MRGNRKAVLTAGLLVSAAMMTGCTADLRPAAKPTMQTAQQQTPQPATAEPDASPAATSPEEPEATPGTLALIVDGKETAQEAVEESGELMLPLVDTGEVLGWKAQTKSIEEETQTKHEITLEKENSRITVAWQVSDNTIRNISWQKDGLLVPVDTKIEMIGDTVYVPAAFFEEAMGAKVLKKQKVVEVSSPEPMETPQTNQ